MKKVLFSLLMAFGCLPMAFSQTKDLTVKQIDTTACGSFSLDNVVYTTDTVLFRLSGDTAYIYDVTIDTGSISTNKVVEACGSYLAPWNEELTEEGYYVKDTVVNGCTRHDTLTLTLHPTYMSDIEYVTAGCSYIWGDTVITDTEIHHITLKTSDYQCDSVLRLQVTSFSNRDTVYDTVASCGRYITAWNDTLAASGDYNNTVTDTVTNCQTTTYINLTINPIYNDSTNIESVIGGCNYVWHGHTYTDINEVHYATVQTVNGCDSLIAIKIESYTNNNYDTTFVEACGNRYPQNGTWHGLFFENPDDTNHLAPLGRTFSAMVADTVNGCITNHQLELTFVQKYDTIVRRGCQEFVYSFDSRSGAAGVKDRATFTVSGEYDTDVNGVELYSRSWSSQCITHHHLDLTVVVPDTLPRATPLNINTCDKYYFSYYDVSLDTIFNDTSFLFQYPFHDITNNMCYDSTINVNVIIRHSTHRDTTVITCDTFTWDFNGRLYTASGVYKKKIEGTTNYQGCDSIGQLTLVINRTPTVTIEGNWILQPGEDANLYANCSDAGVKYKWYKGNSSTPVSTSDSYTVSASDENVDIHLETSKDYSNTVNNSTVNNTCTANNWITVTWNLGIDDVENYMVNIYPNPASRVLNVQSVDGVSEVAIFNTLGQQVLRQSGNGELMQLDLGSLASGNYTLRITAANGEQTTRKINVSK